MTFRGARGRWLSVAGLAAACAVGGMPAAAEPGAPVQPNPTPAPVQQNSDPAEQRVADLQQRLSAARRQLEAVTAAAQLTSEKYNAARALLAQREKEADQAQKAADAARAAAASAREAVHRLAAEIYMQGGSLEEFDAIEVILAPSGTADSISRLAGVTAASGYRQRILGEATQVLAKADALHRTAAAARVKQQAAAAQAQAAFQAAQAQATSAATQTAGLEAQQNALLLELAGLRGTSIEAELRRLDGAELEAARRALEGALRSSGGSALATSKNAARALAFARVQLGKPYVWGGSGPDSWDCSGLTQAAWASAGRRLTHYTGSQWQETQRVALRDLAPGDLVFFGRAPDAIHHVGMYVGNGTMIEAPRTGLNVRYSTIWRADLLPYGGRP